jgi:hypothetical protein
MNKRAGQAILDYVMLLLIIIASLSVMGYYIRNTLSGKMREGADSIGQGEVFRPVDIYHPPGSGPTSLIYYSIENR